MSDQGGTDLTGQIIDGLYRIDSLLGSDYAGQLYLATQLSAERQVTIRILDFIPASERQQWFAQLQQQVAILRSLDHPGLVPVIALGRYNGQPYLVAAYQASVLLAAEAELAPLALERVIHIGLEIAYLLSALHASGTVHGDLRPQNVLLEPTRDLPFVKLTGYGSALARDLTAEDETDLIYLAPERIGGGQPDVRADLFSLGIILYQLSTGELPARPVNGESNAISPRQLNSWIPTSLEGLILELLATDPPARPASAVEVVNRLQRIGQNDLLPTDQPAPSDEEELPGPPSWEL